MVKLLVFALVLSATAYTLTIGWMMWFTFAFFGFDAKSSEIGGMIGFALIALSPIPVCTYCFRRAKALLNGERPKV